MQRILRVSLPGKTWGKPAWQSHRGHRKSAKSRSSPRPAAPELSAASYQRPRPSLEASRQRLQRRQRCKHLAQAQAQAQAQAWAPDRSTQISLGSGPEKGPCSARRSAGGPGWPGALGCDTISAPQPPSRPRAELRPELTSSRQKPRSPPSGAAAPLG